MKTIIAIAFAIATLFTTAANATIVGQQNMEGLCIPLKNLSLLSAAYKAMETDKPDTDELQRSDVAMGMKRMAQSIINYTGDTPEQLFNKLDSYAIMCARLMIVDGEDDTFTEEPSVPAPDPSIDENPPVVTYQKVQPTTPMQRFKARAVQSAYKAQCGTNPTLISNDGRIEIYQSRANNSGRTCTIVCSASVSLCSVEKR